VDSGELFLVVKRMKKHWFKVLSLRATIVIQKTHTCNVKSGAE